MDARLIRHLASLWNRRHHSPAVSTASSLVVTRSPGFALEPRIMLDAALIDTGAEAITDTTIQQSQTGVEPLTDNAELAKALDSLNPPASSNNVILIDPSVPDYEALLAETPDNADVYVLSSSASLAEIADVLADYQNLDAVHIISHGSTGAVALSGEWVDSDSLESQRETLTAIGQSLKEGGDILLYGCNVGNNSEGQVFIERMAELTGADIAASDDLTGSKELRGDWDLEETVGQVPESSLAFLGYQGVLSNTISFDNFNVPGYFGEAATHSEAGVTLTISTNVSNSEFTYYDDGNDPGPLTDNFIDLYHYSVNQGVDPVITVSFDSAVDLTSIVLGSAFQDYAMTLKPVGGVNSDVTTNTIIGGKDGTVTVNLNWTSITGFTIEGAYHGVYFDNFVLGAPANSAPSLTGLPSDITVTEDTASNLDLSAATFSDVNGDAITVTFTLDSGKFTSLADGAGVGSGVTETKVSDTEITLQGYAADINLYLDTASNIKYTGEQDDSGNDAATLTVAATDGTDAMAQQTAKIDIIAVNDNPTASLPASVTVTEDTLSNLDLSIASFGDVDDLSNLTVTLTVDQGTFGWLVNDELRYGVKATLVNSKTITLEGTEANINRYLDDVSNIRYIGAQNASGPGAAFLTVTANDGNGSGDVNLGTISVNITAVNDIPVVDADSDNSSGGAAGYETTFAAGSSSGVTIVDTDFTITDVDNANIVSAVIVLGSIQDVGSESISIDGTPASLNGIAITYTSASQINLSGSATKADYEALIKQVKYSNSTAAISTTSGDRSVTITVNDGADTSASEVSTVSVISAPILEVGSGAIYVENDLNTPVSVVSASASITDSDSANLSGMVISISNAKPGDKITLSGRTDGQTVNGIVITYDSDNQITLANIATKADYLSLLKELQFNNSSQNPDTTNRTISISTTDTDNNTGTTSTAVAVQSVNDEPVATNETGSINEDATLTVTKANGVVDSNGSDADGDSLTVSVIRTGAESGSGTSGTVGAGLAGTYGTLTLNADGSYSYVADQTAADVLNTGDSVTDTFTFTLSDGQGGTDTAEIVITVNGTNDAAVLGSANVSLTETNAALSTGGTLTNSDVDNANTFQAQTNVAGNYGTFNIGTGGAWTYVANSVFDHLDAGDIVSDTFTVTATDGTQTSVKVTINGSNDASVVSGTHTGSVTEGDQGDAAVTATGTLSISDVDDDDAPSFADQAATAGDQGYGSFVLSAGQWTYTLDQSKVQQLSTGQQVSDSINFTATDGTVQTITVTITGTNDAAVLSSADVSLSETNAALSTGGTLTNSDVDNADTFQAQTNVAGNYGTFNIGTDGAWTYVANSAFDSLDAGDIVSDIFTVTATDGTQISVKVTINGSNDAAVVSGTYTGSVTEGNEGDAAVTTTGSLSISDVDDDDTPSFADQTAIAGDQGYGVFVLSAGQWTYTLDQSKVQQLSAGQQVSDSIDFTATDGTVQTITVTITGTNDVAVLSSADEQLTETNAALSTGGTLTNSDVDNANTFQARTNVAGNYGTFNIATNGAWTYVANSAFDNLDVGDNVSDTFTVTATDGTQTSVKVTINGSNDAAVLSSADVSLSETNEALSTGGTLTINDVDNVDTFQPQSSVVGNYGTFTIGVNGDWTYVTNSAFDALDAGDSISDNFVVNAIDGTQTSVRVTINGSDDASVVSGTYTGTVTEGNAGDTQASTTGTLSISDPDSNDNPSFADVAAVVGDQGYGSFALTAGQWTYTLNRSAVQDLNAGEQLTDTFTFIASDGRQQVISITILGTNEAPVVQQPSDSTPAVIEVARDFVPEPAIPDPVRQSDGNIATSLTEGQPAEAPASDIDAGAGSAADTVKNEQGLISSGSATTKAFSVQGLFNQQSAIDARYGSNLVTTMLNSPSSVGSLTSASATGSMDVLSGFGYEAEQSEELLQDDAELEEEDERNDPAPEDGASDAEGQEPSSESAESTVIPAQFSDYLALAVDQEQESLARLNKALMAIAESK